jgi:hypothetical protein
MTLNDSGPVYAPPAEVVLAEAQAEERARRSAAGLAGLVRRLPWPLLVLPPFMAAVMLPLLGLAVLFGAFASRGHVQDSVRLTSSVEVRGMKAVHADPPEVDFGEVADGAEAAATVTLTNDNADPAWVVVTAAGIPPGCALTEAPDGPVYVRPGGSAEIHLGVTREAGLDGGEYRFRLILLASPEQ